MPTFSKNFSQSLTIRFNAFVVAAGVVTAKLLAILTAAAVYLNSAEAKQFLAALPPHAQVAVNHVLLIIGAAISVIGFIGMLIRVLLTTGPVRPPQFGRGGALLLAVLVCGCLVGCTTAVTVGKIAARAELEREIAKRCAPSTDCAARKIDAVAAFDTFAADISRADVPADQRQRARALFAEYLVTHQGFSQADADAAVAVVGDLIVAALKPRS